MLLEGRDGLEEHVDVEGRDGAVLGATTFVDDLKDKKKRPSWRRPKE